MNHVTLPFIGLGNSQDKKLDFVTQIYNDGWITNKTLFIDINEGTTLRFGEEDASKFKIGPKN